MKIEMNLRWVEMELGLKKNEVRLVPFSELWESEFNRVKQEITKHTNINDHCIEHIGSTAILNMIAKPILDIVVAVKDKNNLDESLLIGLKEAGFLRLRVERPSEIVFAKFTDHTYEVKTHYIHLVQQEGELWNNLIFFRDYLNLHQDAREEYKQIKLAFVRTKDNGIEEYTSLKEDFVKSIYSKRANY